MMVGSENYDWDELERSADYKGEYHRQHPTIVMFWSVFRALSEGHRKAFLRFLTGNDRVPILGMRSIPVRIQPVYDTKCLPVAHTCYNLLDLPPYENAQILREKLLTAIQNAEGFGLV